MKWMRLGLMIMMVMVPMHAEGEASSAKLQAVKVMNHFIHILQRKTFEEAAKKVVPLIHKSLLTHNGKSLDDDTYGYSFKKAYMNAKNYKYPIKVTRVQKLRTTGVGYGDTYQKGIEYKFWIAKKQGTAGLPAPLVLFFPKGQKMPKLTYIGSL